MLPHQKKRLRPSSAPLGRPPVCVNETAKLEGNTLIWNSSTKVKPLPRAARASETTAAVVPPPAPTAAPDDMQPTPSPSDMTAIPLVDLSNSQSSKGHLAGTPSISSSIHSSTNSLNGSALKRLRPKSALRAKVLSETKMRSLGVLVGGSSGGVAAIPPTKVKRKTPSEIEQELTEELQLITGHTGQGAKRTVKKHRYVAAHRAALHKYMETLDVSGQSLLSRIFEAYEDIEMHRFEQDQTLLADRATEAEHRMRIAEEVNSDLKLQLEHHKLQIDNLTRQLNARNEMISQISSTHRINVNSVNWITGVENKVGAAAAAAVQQPQPHQQTQRTMAEIRTIQKRVTAAYGEATRRAQRDEEGEAMELRREVENDEDRHQIELTEEQLGDVSNIAGKAAVDVMAEKNGQTAPPAKQKIDKSSKQEQSMRGVQAYEPLSTADTYRNCQRIENIGVDLEVTADEHTLDE